MSAHTYRTVDVVVPGGDLHVGVWDPVAPQTGQVLLVHGVTSSHLAWPFVVEFRARQSRKPTYIVKTV